VCCSFGGSSMGPSHVSNITFPVLLATDEALRFKPWRFDYSVENYPHRRREDSLQLGYPPIQRPTHPSRFLAALCSSCSMRSSVPISAGFHAKVGERVPIGTEPTRPSTALVLPILPPNNYFATSTWHGPSSTRRSVVLPISPL
jgi:hypothetical protein